MLETAICLLTVIKSSIIEISRFLLGKMGFGSIAPGLDRVAVPLVHLAGLDLKVESKGLTFFDNVQ